MKKSLHILFLLTFQIGTTIAQTPEFEWVHTHGSTLDDMGGAITTDAQNNVYISGYFTGDVDFDPGAGITTLSSGSSSIGFIQKMNANGDLVWAKPFPQGGYSSIGSIVTDQSGNLILAGFFSGNLTFSTSNGTQTIESIGYQDAFIAKMDGSGNFVWVKSFGYVNQDDAISKIQLDEVGNIYSTGYFYGTCDFDPGPGTANLSSAGGSMDIFVQKLTAAGDYIWAKKIGAGGFDMGLALDVKGSTIALTGWFQNNVDFDPSPTTYSIINTQGYGDIYLLSLTTDGDFNWVKSFGSSMGDKGIDVAIANNGQIYLTGTFDAVIDLDPGTGTSLFTPVNSSAFFVLQLTDSGDLNWAKAFTGANWQGSNALALHPTNGVVIAAGFSGTCDFDPGNGVSNLTAVGGGDAALVYLDQNGNYIWAGSYGNNDPNTLLGDGVPDISIDNLGNFYATGFFYDTVDFDCGTGIAEAVTAGSYDIYILKLNSSTLSVSENALNDFKLYPNPANEQLSISVTGLNNCHVTICNSLGTIVLEKDISDAETQLDIRSLSAGSYVVQLTNELDSSYQTFVKIN
ncbi:T9SS type A sorting domain-containing protein [Fluviicola taffensis]|uniref:T9SS type A sorting domain-containing protein n=1 Tax=Fluviicola taffensis TaxID=191579 RepID=UPI003137B909